MFSRNYLYLNVFLGFLLLTGWQAVGANDFDQLRTTDYFINHISKEPFYAENNLDPNVILHVREVVLAGRERSVAKDGKALLLVHGATFPGYVAFDLDYQNVSMMRHFAKLGWDVFAVDLEGYGQSTRPPVMDNPKAFPDSKAPIGPDVTVANVARTVDFIRDMRGVEKVHILGWSLGAALEAPLYTIQEPDKVAKLIIHGAGYHEWSITEEEAREKAIKRHAQKNRYGRPGDAENRFSSLTKLEYIVPGVLDVYAKAHLASDPKSGELGGQIRAPWGRFIGWQTPSFDASKITVPTLVIRGESDPLMSKEDNLALVEELGSEVKKYVEIPKSGHMGHYEITNQQFYKAIQDFLEGKE